MNGHRWQVFAVAQARFQGILLEEQIKLLSLDRTLFDDMMIGRDGHDLRVPNMEISSTI
jgi:hypothetical protein